MVMGSMASLKSVDLSLRFTFSIPLRPAVFDPASCSVFEHNYDFENVMMYAFIVECFYMGISIYRGQVALQLSSH